MPSGKPQQPKARKAKRSINTPNRRQSKKVNRLLKLINEAVSTSSLKQKTLLQ